MGSTQQQTEEDKRFAQWLLTHRPVGLTAVKGDSSWNAATVVAMGNAIVASHTPREGN